MTRPLAPAVDFDAIREATRSVDRLDDRILSLANEVFDHRIAGVSLSGGGGGGAEPYQFAFSGLQAGLSAEAIVVKPITLTRVTFYSPLASFSGQTGQLGFDLAITSIDMAAAPGPPGSDANPWVSLVGSGTPLYIGGVTWVFYQDAAFAGWSAVSIPALSLMRLRITVVSGISSAGAAIEYQ